MEIYAINKLEHIFHGFVAEPTAYPGLYRRRAAAIVAEIKNCYPCEDDFRLVFWKILCNLKLNRPNCQIVLTKLFQGHWKTARAFVLASHDELDENKAFERMQARKLSFEKMQRTNAFMQEIEQKAVHFGDNLHQENNSVIGLLCPRCKSNKTEYLLLQTSRGDEGSTMRSLCNECGFRWKFR
jgi:DNA-directed RNA polymerase subunit M/transcription elongation factor TFIIS